LWLGRVLFEWIVRFAESSTVPRSFAISSFFCRSGILAFCILSWYLQLFFFIVLVVFVCVACNSVACKGNLFCAIRHSKNSASSSYKQSAAMFLVVLLGCRGVCVLEPSCGKGNYFGESLSFRVARLLPETTVVSARCLHSSSSSRPSSRRVVYLFVVSSCLSCIEVLPWRVVSPRFNGWLLPSVLVRVLCVGNAVPFTGNCLALFGVK
jgi:hypothetical protein